MTGLESTLTNAVAPTIIVFLFIGYLQKRDTALQNVLSDISKSNTDLQRAIRSQKEAIEKMYGELIKKQKTIEDYKHQLDQ